MAERDKLLELVRAQSMDYKWASMFIKKLADDEEHSKTDPQTAR